METENERVVRCWTGVACCYNCGRGDWVEFGTVEYYYGVVVRCQVGVLYYWILPE